MKLEENYSFIRVCPETNRQITREQYAYSNGVCPHCGNVQNGTFTHGDKIVGKWENPSFIECLFLGKDSIFHTKEELTSRLNK